MKVIELNNTEINIDEIKKQQYILNYLKSIPIASLYINNFYNLFQNQKYLFLIIQYFDSISLQHVKKHIMRLSDLNYETLIQYLVKQILKGLDVIHSKNIPHGDISFNNIVINHKMNKDVQIKFINFIPNTKTATKLKLNIKKSKKIKV